jgi:membrane protease YdiL (CAAX protease family)
MLGGQEQTARHYLEWSRRGKCALGRYVLAIFLAFAGWFILPIPFVVLVSPFLRGTLWFEKFTLLFPFMVGFVVILGLVKLLLGRPSWSVALPRWPSSIMPYLTAIALGLLLTLVSTILLDPFVTISYQGLEPLLSVSALSIAVTLVGLVIQTGFEELLFRGLIMQFLMRMMTFAPLAIIIQALLFGAMHVANIAEWHSNLWGIAPYVLAGISYGYAAWRTGSLLVSAALHFINNAGSAYLIGAESDVLPTVAPWLIVAPTINQATVAGVIIVVTTVIAVETYVRSMKEIRSNLIEEK